MFSVVERVFKGARKSWGRDPLPRRAGELRAAWVRRARGRLARTGALPLGLLLLAGCGGDEEADVPRVVRPAHLEDDGGVRVAAAWVHGEAWLTLESSESFDVTWEVDAPFADEPQSESTVTAGRGAVRLACPGEGSRAVVARWDVSANVENVTWTHAPPVGPPRDAWRGALSGRSLIVLLADALHAGQLHAYGSPHETSPHLDRLAAEGVRFHHAYSQTSWTVPSVTSMWTGVTQERHGVREVGLRLNDRWPLLAESFAEADVFTAAWTQNGLVGRGTGLARGFDVFEERTGEQRGAMHDDVLSFLDAPIETPFFLWAHYLPPHEPYRPPEPYRSRFGGTLRRPSDGTSEVIERVNRRGASPTDPERRSLESLYRGNVAYFDSLVGDVIKRVKAQGMEQDVAVLVLADHGEAMGQHRFIGHNIHVFDEMVRIPMILWAPGAGLPEGRVVDAPVTALDLWPTLAELFDLGAAGAGGDGESWAGLLNEGEGDVDGGRLLRLSARYVPRGPSQERSSLQRAVLVGRFKLVVDARGGAPRLFDLSSDPGETRDIYAERPTLARALTSEVQQWEAEDGGATPFEVGAGLQTELEQLGYMRRDSTSARPEDEREDGP